jgi:hypothetical protein
MQEHIVRDKVESIRKIKIYSLSLTLTADNRGQEDFVIMSAINIIPLLRSKE